MGKKMEEKAARGQSIRTETGPDRSSHKVNAREALMGREMTGGVTNLGHSISGANSVSMNDKK
jgi:hypothetical protein